MSLLKLIFVLCMLITENQTLIVPDFNIDEFVGCPLKSSVPDCLLCLRSDVYSNLVRSQTDESGLITTSIFERNTSNLNFWLQNHWEEYQIRIPDDYVVVGGGIKGSNKVGNLITASYPNNDLSAWIISSKDHAYAEAINAQGYAIGLKIEGMSRDDLLEYIYFCSKTSNSGVATEEPNANAKLVPDNYLLIGGGIEVNWRYHGNSGNLAYGSYPINNGWQVNSKSHLYSSKAVTHSFVIGIRTEIIINEVAGKIVNDISFQKSGLASYPVSSVMAKQGFALTSCGAKVDNLGYGNFLWKMQPVKTGEEKSFNGCEASSKDHAIASPTSLTTYAVSIKFVANKFQS